MGKKRNNWIKALLSRPQAKNIRKVATVKVDFKVRADKYDESNAFVLPSHSRKKKGKKPMFPGNVSRNLKPLTKKQKRFLAKVVEKKKKKTGHAELLQKLQKVQATSEEMKLMQSTSSMQTHGFKKQAEGATAFPKTKRVKINTIKGSRRKNFLPPPPPAKKAKLDHNAIDLDEDSDSSCSSTDSEEMDEFSKPNVESLRHFGEVVNQLTTANKNCEEDVSPEQDNGKLVEITSNSSCDLESAKPCDSEPGKPCDSKPEKICEPAVFIAVNRSPEIQAIREALPIYAEEQSIMEAVKEHSVVVIHGATGTGKTTQVPQFLYEAGYARNKMLIGITEPRRVAAVQMAKRVAEEMNLPDAVSYHIRYEKTATDEKTEIKFMTDGVLLKEIRHDFFLTRYSVIIIDEAHERSIFSDVLIGLLSRIIPVREKRGKPLKLIIMSATLNIKDFTENPRLFKEVPRVLTLDSRQYDVVAHFEKRTQANYIQAAYEKVCKIHRKLPLGAILVFVTGEKEVTHLCKLLKKAFPFRRTKKSTGKDAVTSDNEEFEEFVKFKRRKRKWNYNESSSSLPKIYLDDYSVEPLDSEGLQHHYSDDDEGSDEDHAFFQEFPHFLCEPLYVLPFYSILSSAEQSKVFKPPPPGSRLCVVATNVAETSVTIPGLKYVVDTGKVKTRVYDHATNGVSCFAISWISKASANQRAGRAGRTEGGHCYRLYSSSIFEHEFPDFSPPAIQTVPVDDILLQMKSLGIDRVVNFPFPTSPDVEALKAAERRLVKLDALHDLKKGERYKDVAKWEFSAKVTPMGKLMSRFPLSPRYAKMLIVSKKHEVTPYIIAIVSAMTVPEVFSYPGTSAEKSEADKEDGEEKSGSNTNSISPGQGKYLQLGDAMVLLKAVASYEEANKKMNFCTKFNIRHKAMVQINKMRSQLTREWKCLFKNSDLSNNLRLEPPTVVQVEKIRKVLSSGFPDHVARRIPEDELRETELRMRNAYKCLDLEEPVFIHPSSVLSKKLPKFVMYQDIFQTSKYFMRMVIEVEPAWLPAVALNQCVISPPLETPPPHYDKIGDQILCTVTSTFGPYNWQIPPLVMPMSSGLFKYTWFCYLFIDGQICPSLKAYSKFLLSSSSVMLKPWARLLPRTRSILDSVISKGVDSKKALCEVWKKNNSYLLSQYCQWLPDNKHLEVALNWPPK